MKKYTRKYYSYTKATGTQEHTESYEQPLKDRLIFTGFNGFTKIVYLKPLRHVVEGPLDDFFYKKHRKSCSNDCVKGKVRVSPDATLTSDEGWEEQDMCGYVSISARLDIKHFDLDTKNNVILKL